LLVDDHDITRNLLASHIARIPRIEIVGHARDGDEGVRQAASLHPDLVLMDVQMPRMDGIAATRAIKRFPTPPRVVIVSASPSYFREARAAGADACCEKSHLRAQLLGLIQGLFPHEGGDQDGSRHEGSAAERNDTGQREGPMN
jgi:DNA-binding NarL/FixJ family response regulator